jgi:tetratricopeptide (TPR) repeat protein
MSQLQDLFDRGLTAHQAGDFAGAEALYGQVLAAEPRSFGALHMLGVVRAQQGLYPEAIDLIGAALKRNPGNAAAWINHGNVLAASGQAAEAIASYSRALGLNPRDIQTRATRAELLRQTRQFYRALVDYDTMLAARPDLAAIHAHRGMVLAELGRHDEAVAASDRALVLEPAMTQAWNNRGYSLRELARFDEALESVDRALALQPDYAAAFANRGKALSESDRIGESMEAYRRAAELLRDAPVMKAEHKLRHDVEQAAHIAALGNASPPGARVDRAVNPAGPRVADEWRGAAPQIAVIDDLLTPQALAALRRVCTEPDIWRNVNPAGYLGAFPENGFAAPLLAQIAEELRDGFPDIFRGHPLRYHWAFKYDSTLKGIAIHADEAAVNVNFWITPDDANLDSEKGGLVIWDVAAPLDWDFGKFNGDSAAIRDFLAKGSAKPTTVPYRANRAVIFDSDLFHETDSIRFKDGYLNRRINVTMLFGRRDSPRTD